MYGIYIAVARVDEIDIGITIPSSLISLDYVTATVRDQY